MSRCLVALPTVESYDGPSLTTSSRWSLPPGRRLSRSGRSEAENLLPPLPIPMEMFRAALRPHSCTEALAQGVPHLPVEHLEPRAPAHWMGSAPDLDWNLLPVHTSNP